MELSSANGVINVTNLSKILAHSPTSLITINIQFFLAPSRLGKTFPHIWKRERICPFLLFLHIPTHVSRRERIVWVRLGSKLMCDKKSNTLCSVPSFHQVESSWFAWTTEIFCPRVRSSRHEQAINSFVIWASTRNSDHTFDQLFCVSNFRNFTYISFTSTYYMWCCFTLDRGVCTCEIKKIALIFTRILFSILKKILPCPCLTSLLFPSPSKVFSLFKRWPMAMYFNLYYESEA